MAIGERIRFIRNLRGMTQKWLGQAVGFPPKTADVRMAQYESGSRTPKEDLVKAIANVLEVSPLALQIPDIDSDLGFIHTLFAIEDIHGIRAEKQGDEVHLIFDGSKRTMDELNTPGWNRQYDRASPTPIPLKSYTLSASPTPSV